MEKKSRLLLYDTSNFVNLPIGGQLTSISNFLKYVREEYGEILDNTVLVGVSTDPGEIGVFSQVDIHGKKVAFFPVAQVETDLGHTQKSLRAAYVKGLLKYGKRLGIRKRDCNYLHTPEAFGPVKLLCPTAKCAVFSHGSFFNMEKGFRFFQNNPLIKKGFMLYIRAVIRKAAVLFCLDKDSEEAYLPYNKQVLRVNNSIIRESGEWVEKPFDKALVFVGRLSGQKRVEPIIKAVLGMEEDYRLTIIGDGEEYENLISYANDRIIFTGAIPPSEVKQYLKKQNILIMNSILEGIPMTILEGLSFGLPVVTTDVGGIGSVVRFGVDAEKTDGSEKSIEKAIRKIAADYGRYSRAAFSQADQFDYRQVNREIMDRLLAIWPDLIRKTKEVDLFI